MWSFGCLVLNKTAFSFGAGERCIACTQKTQQKTKKIQNKNNKKKLVTQPQYSLCTAVPVPSLEDNEEGKFIKRKVTNQF